MPTDYRLQDRFGYRLSRLSKMMQGRLEAQLMKHEITRLQWCVLSGVALEGKTAPSQLADHVGITRPAISRLLKAMVSDGLIQRNLTEQDGRSRRIFVTKKGEEKLNLCLPLVENNQQHFLKKLSPEQQTAFDEVLQVLISGEAEIFDDL